jgi:transcriptional regulator with XRE-family HTH domain
VLKNIITHVIDIANNYCICYNKGTYSVIRESCTMSVSTRIIRRREELKLTQTELAKRAGLKPPAISQYESGARSPSYEALRKLSNALDVTTDYLISGQEVKLGDINEKTAKILLNIIQDMSIENREKLLQYTISLVNPYNLNSEIPILNGVIDYADYIYQNYGNNNLPIDVYDIAKKLNITIYEDDLSDEEGEGILIKNSNKMVIIIDKKINYKQRVKFTIATLIGHAIIPWHIESSYNIRKKGTSTLHSEKAYEIEAHKFAAFLIMPQIWLTKELGKDKNTLEQIKKIALEKFAVSVTTFLYQMVDFQKEKYTVIISMGTEISSGYSGNRPLVDIVNENSFAYSFTSNSTELEGIRCGNVPAKYWFTDSKDDEVIYEESNYNPEFNSVITLLTIK